MKLVHLIGIAVLSIMAVVVSSCKKSPTDSSDPIEAVALGSYVGYGNLGGGMYNAWLAIYTASDSTDTTETELGGFIEYNGIRSIFLSVTTNESQDTVHIQYVRGSVSYDASAEIKAGSLEFAYSSPEGQPSIRFNREIGGYNMTGRWTGMMSSNAIGIVEPATMLMDQEGSLFLGTVTVEFLSTLRGDVTSGATSQADFQLGGTSQYGTTIVGFSMLGRYTQQDTIYGSWEAGNEFGIDNGNFQFTRSFE